ncbi:MAG: F0F1 ATP synthase subunit B [Lachnospiraceae bacterium]|nr:F0F1 ATP synthase subunit B [Lachnospiraceae bacterium]
MSYLFDLNLQLIADAALMIVAIFVLFLVVGNLLFNPIRDILQKRQDKIKTELETAASDMEKAKELKAEYEEKLKAIDKEADTILSDARKKAVANENKIVAEAKEEAARIIERARVEAELEKQKVADEVKKEMVSIASMIAGKVVSGAVDVKVQDSLVEETLKEIGDSTWLS